LADGQDLKCGFYFINDEKSSGWAKRVAGNNFELSVADPQEELPIIQVKKKR
jgi:hypothetical protein